MPCPSGPRCRTNSAIFAKITGETGAMSKFNHPAMPHMPHLTAKTANNRDTRVLHNLTFHLQPKLSTPGSDLPERLTMGVGRRIPVEINVIHFVQREIRPMERLEDVP